MLANKDRLIELEYQHFAVTVLMDFDIECQLLLTALKEKIIDVL